MSSDEDQSSVNLLSTANELGRQLLSAQSSQHRAIANEIFNRLQGGEEVDDIMHLIQDLNRTSTSDIAARQDTRTTSEQACAWDDDQDWG